jgi:immune inhibitor A
MARALRRMTLVAAFCLVAGTVVAVPAYRNVAELLQPDGRSFRARLWGDERHHGYETEDGFTVEQDRSTRFWHFVGSDESGAVRRLSTRPGIDAPPAGLRRGVRPLRPRVDLAALRSQATGGVPIQAVSAPAERTVPRTGTANVPVFLVDFNDTTSTFSAASFETLLFGGAYGMAAYYSSVSYGAFTVSSGPEGIAGWFEAPKTHDYYGQNVDGDDAWPGDLVHDAVAAADAAGFDFAPYDQDGDCYVDNAVVIHQGGGEEFGGAPSTNIWSHSWDLNSAKYFGRSTYGAFTTRSNCAAAPSQKVRVNKYTLQPELYGTGTSQTTIGVVAHEFGHALGLPDLYDTDGSSQGAGDWTIMASGSWNGVVKGGDRPAHLGPWEKWRLGWITPIAASCSALASFPAASNSPAGIYRLRDGSAPSGTGEYFLVENRQNTSAFGFDDGLPGNGLLIWHVDETQPNNQGECWPGPATPPPLCSTSSRYKVAVVQADNLWELERNVDQGDASDPFPGTSGRTVFDATSTPSSKLYSGASSGASVTGISASATTMTATLAAPGAPALTITKSGNGSGTVSSAPAGISCGATCVASFSCGTPVSLSAVAAAGSIFDGWSGDCDGVGACSLTMDQAHTVAATFSALPSKLSIGDATLSEGDDGTKTITFTVTRTP